MKTSANIARTAFVAAALTAGMLTHAILAAPSAAAESATTPPVTQPVTQLDILRAVPLEVGSYMTDAYAYPETFTTADEVLQALNSKRNVLFHMEAIRRGYHQLPENQKGPLLTRITKRYQAAPDDPVLFFDQGYAQLVFERNKTGLFFLRKANDRLQDQFSSLAYAMAQAESDLRDEQGTPDNMTSRKVDIVHKMQDAARRNAENPKPGFWPSFIRVMETLKPLPAYSSLTGTDFSVEAVPYGSLPSSAAASTAVASAETGSPVYDTQTESCSLTADPAFNPSQAINTRKLDLNNDGYDENIHFFKKEGDELYDVLVLDRKQLAIASFKSSVAPYIVEDLDGDRIYELVIRQYKQDPLNPVKVYRYDGCQYVPDKDIDALFQ